MPLTRSARRGYLRPMVGKKRLEDTQQVGLRLPTILIRRADAYAAQLAAENPGMGYTRTDVIRIILARHLPRLPEEGAPPALTSVSTRPVQEPAGTRGSSPKSRVKKPKG